MADARHRFVPTAPAPTRALRRSAPPGAAKAARAGTAWALVLGVAVLLGRPLFMPPGGGDAAARFASQHPRFNLIKDMLLAEPTVTSVGADNVREYWLFDGRWSSPRLPGRFLSRADMLEAVGLAPVRYEAYLDILKSLGAFRAARSGSGPAGRVTVHMLPSSKGEASSTRVVHVPAGATVSRHSVPLGEGWYIETDGR